MARPAERFVSSLTEKEKKQLLKFWKDDESHRVRCRAHAILMSNDQWEVVDIANAFQVTVQTVYSWLDRWEPDQDLEDAPRSGAPPTLDNDEQQTALEEIEKSPQNPSGAIDNIERKIGKRISMGILHRLIKRSGMIWKRMRGSLQDRRE